MNSRQLKSLSTRIVIMAVGLSVFFYYAGQFQVKSAVEVAAFIVAVVAVKLTDRFAEINVSFESPFIIAAIILFPLPDSLFIAVGGLLLTNFIRQEKEIPGGPLYLFAERSLVVFISSLWLGGKYLLAQGERQLNFFSYEAVLIILVCLTFFLFGLVLKEINLSLTRAVPFWPSFLSDLQLLSQIYVALGSIGVLTALMFFSMGVYTLVLFIIPLLVVRYSFKLFLDIKDTYHQTIAALSRVIEVEDPHQSSHSERVAEMSTSIARELGLAGNRLEAVSYAALLHDIGRLGLDADSFDSYLDTDDITDEQIPHALIGAEILEQVEFLAPFASIVANHHVPFSPNKRQLDSEHPLESRIIAVANYYDRLTATREITRRLTPNQAVAKIKKEAFQFDPKVVRSLIGVLRRQGKLITVKIR